jgi:hypothetical protein
MVQSDSIIGQNNNNNDNNSNINNDEESTTILIDSEDLIAYTKLFEKKLSKYNKLMCYDNCEMTLNIVLVTLIIVFWFVLIPILDASIITLTQDKVVITPYDNNSQGDNSTLIIKPCIYNNSSLGILYQSDTLPKDACLPDYNLVSTWTFCGSRYQNSDYICMLNNISSTAYPLDCNSIYQLGILYDEYETINNSIIINVNQGINKYVIATLWFLLLLVIIVACSFPIMCTTRFSQNDEIVAVTFSLKSYYLCCLSIFFLLLFLVMIFLNNGTGVTGSIMSINCSDIDIYSDLNFVQRIFVSSTFRWGNLSYDNMNYYYNFTQYFFWFMFLLMPCFCLYCLIVCVIRMSFSSIYNKEYLTSNAG